MPKSRSSLADMRRHCGISELVATVACTAAGKGLHVSAACYDLHGNNRTRIRTTITPGARWVAPPFDYVYPGPFVDVLDPPADFKFHTMTDSEAWHVASEPRCILPPKGWHCRLQENHGGSCPTWPDRAGFLHNVIGHPLLWAWPRVGRWIHDHTEP